MMSDNFWHVVCKNGRKFKTTHTTRTVRISFGIALFNPTGCCLWVASSNFVSLAVTERVRVEKGKCVKLTASTVLVKHFPKIEFPFSLMKCVYLYALALICFVIKQAHHNHQSIEFKSCAGIDVDVDAFTHAWKFDN